jgi:prevent-host-death family protein
MGIEVPISEAKAKLADLVRRAEAGEDVALTRHGQVAVRLVASTTPTIDRERRQRAFDELARRAARRPPPAIKAEFSQDFLYDSNGLPV